MSRFTGIRRLLAAAAVGTLALTLAPGAGAGGDAVRAAAASCTANRSVQMVEANIKSGMTAAQTRADLAKAYADKPDFVALNEVAGRSDGVLAPAGYALFRTPGRYTGSNVVTWRTDRWIATAQGTIYVTNVPGKTARQTTELGLRYASWATLRSKDGCQTLSVVSYHVAPNTEPIGDLIAASVKKLGGLATQLAADGPVLMAGDLNRHIGARTYPRAALTSYGLKPTWDLTGKVLATHDSGGATIDYIFVRNAAQFTVTRQVTRELYSDHDAVVANLTINPRIAVARTPQTFVRGHVVNLPTSSASAGRRAVVDRLTRAVNLAPKGAIVQIATDRFNDGTFLTALRNAHRRGVIIQLVTTSPELTVSEQRLQSLLGSRRGGGSWAIQRPKRATGLPPTAVMINRTADVELFGLQVDRTLDSRMSLHLARGQFTLEKADFTRLRNGFVAQIQ